MQGSSSSVHSPIILEKEDPCPVTRVAKGQCTKQTAVNNNGQYAMGNTSRLEVEAIRDRSLVKMMTMLTRFKILNMRDGTPARATLLQRRMFAGKHSLVVQEM